MEVFRDVPRSSLLTILQVKREFYKVMLSHYKALYNII